MDQIKHFQLLNIDRETIHLEKKHLTLHNVLLVETNNKTLITFLTS